MELLASILDFFLPRYCPGCNKKLQPGEDIVCPNCISSIPKPTAERLQSEYRRKFASDNIISGFNSLFIFEKEKELQHIIHSVKYNNKFLVGIYLGQLIGKELKPVLTEWQIDCIVPVPLHHLKKAERGFNQSAYIAKGLGKEINKTVKTNLVKRLRYTQSQTELNLEERRQNILGAFSAKHLNYIKGKTFLLLDDVITTGATIKECGKVLRDAGAKDVYACSVAIAK